MRDVSRISEAELDAALTELGRTAHYPTVPDLSDRVMERLRAPAPAHRSRRSWSWTLAAAAVVAFALTLAALASPDLRRAVADWLGVPGIRISLDGDAPRPRTSGDLELGPRVTLARARARVDFEVALPRAALGPVDSVHLTTPPPGGQVSLVYGPGPGLPAAKSTGVGLLLTQFSGEVRREFMHKIATEGVEVEPVRVDGNVGYWLQGRPHFVLYLDESGNLREETVRFADNVLLWEQDGVVFRLESALDLQRALTIARSVQ